MSSSYDSSLVLCSTSYLFQISILIIRLLYILLRRTLRKKKKDAATVALTPEAQSAAARLACAAMRSKASPEAKAKRAKAQR